MTKPVINAGFQESVLARAVVFLIDPERASGFYPSAFSDVVILAGSYQILLSINTLLKVRFEETSWKNVIKCHQVVIE